MVRKLILMIAVAAVLAVAIPATASAAQATCPAGTTCPVGTKFTATGKNVTFTTSTLGAIKCTTLNFNGEITVEGGGVVEGKGNTTDPTQTGCENGADRPADVTTFNVTKLFANGTATSGTKSVFISFTAVVDLPSGVVCTLTGTNVAGTYTYGTNVVKWSNATGITSTGGCGTAKFDAEFALEIIGTTTAVVLD